MYTVWAQNLPVFSGLPEINCFPKFVLGSPFREWKAQRNVKLHVSEHVLGTHFEPGSVSDAGVTMVKSIWTLTLRN